MSDRCAGQWDPLRPTNPAIQGVLKITCPRLPTSHPGQKSTGGSDLELTFYLLKSLTEIEYLCV